MPPSPGSLLGPYEIVSALGAGGMGTVFRARDTRLNRQVAIKVLPATLAANPDRISRFAREAQVLGALNHPHIAQLYGVEAMEDGWALVMELIEGEDLADRLARGPLPLADALAVARQLAEALEAAHERGIVHRDLEPANIRLTADGVAKVLDFGLAKPANEIGPASDSVPTVTSPAQMTQEGVVLGTAAYMAPEQAKGKPVDRRADIWAFGCVVYELLSGRRLYDAETVAETIGLILTRDADLSGLPRTTPARVRELIERCLQQDPRSRLRDMGDARIELERAIGEPELAASARRWTPASIAAMLAVAIACTLVGWWIARAAATHTPIAAYTLRPLTELAGAELHPALSPDGRQLAYVSSASGNLDIYLQRVGGDRAINLTQDSPADDSQPAFSSDGQLIAFRSERDGGGLFVMGATGESVRRVTRAGYDQAFSPDSRFLVYSTERVDDPYARQIIAELWTVELATGATSLLVKGDAVQPAWSPDGRRVAYWGTDRGQRDLWTVAADGSAPVRVTNDRATDWSPAWSSDSQWLYFASDRGGSMNLWRVRVDSRTGLAEAAPEQQTTSVRNLGYPRLAAADSRIAVMSYERSTDLSIYSLDGDRIVLTKTLRLPSANRCAPAPDGAWIACSTRGAAEDLAMFRPDGSDFRKLTNDAHMDRNVTWHPGGRSLAFYSTRSGDWEYWSIGIDGSAPRPLSRLAEVTLLDLLWSPDGQEVMIGSARCGDVWRFRDAAAGTTRESARRVDAPVPGLRLARWSPSGRHVAGVEASASGELSGIGVWDLEANHYRRFDVETAGTRTSLVIAGWLSDSRHLIARTADGVAMIDAEAGTVRRVLLPAGPQDAVALSADGRTLTVEREHFDSDIWMLERNTNGLADRR